MKRKFLRADISGLFSHLRLYGYYCGKDIVGNVKLRITHRFERDWLHTPKKGLLGVLFSDTKTIWSEGNDEDWNSKIGEILCLKIIDEDTQIIESSKEEADLYHKKFKAYMAIPGATLGIR